MKFHLSILFSVTLVGVALAGTEKTDAAALCDFYKTVSESGKGKLENWCTASGPCTEGSPWAGVSCTNGRVDVIAISGLGGGRLPASFGNLDQLIMLSFMDNGLTGGIPSELGLLTKMESLWLNENKLTGPIPASICAYKKTATIDFYANPGISCYASCLASRPEFMSHGRGNVRTVCPANGGGDLPPVVVNDCSDAPNPATLYCSPGTRRTCSGGKWICHGLSAGSTSTSTTTTSSKAKCPDTKWKALTGSPLRCSAPRGVNSCPSGWKKTASATSTKGVTCSKSSAPTRQPTPPPVSLYYGTDDSADSSA